MIKRKVFVAAYDVVVLFVLSMLAINGLEKPSSIEFLALFSVHSFFVIALFVVEFRFTRPFKSRLVIDQESLLFVTMYIGTRFLVIGTLGILY